MIARRCYGAGRDSTPYLPAVVDPYPPPFVKSVQGISTVINVHEVPICLKQQLGLLQSALKSASPFRWSRLLVDSDACVKNIRTWVAITPKSMKISVVLSWLLTGLLPISLIEASSDCSKINLKQLPLNEKRRYL